MTDPSADPGATNAVARNARAAQLRLRAVRRVFDDTVEAIRDLDLDVPAGQFLALLGPSGCGKSTLLRIIAGLDRADAGNVRVGHGSRADDTAPGRSDTVRVAFVFQDAHLLPWRNVLRNVALPLELQGIARTERLERAVSAIEQVGLGDALRRYPAQLSGGMRMRVSLARALVTEPELLLLDEPFAALDEITRQHLDDQLRELWWRRRMTVLFVTHSIVEAAFLAERAVVFTRRPARIVLDHPLDLPPQRTPELRTDPAFAREMRLLFDALRRGEQS